MWFMRQAGRSLPEYRAIRERHSFWEVAGTPELCAEVTLQPVRRHGVDAAVMFADIMTPVLGMGLHVDLVEGVGPVVEQPVRTVAAVEALRVPDPDEAFAPLLEAIGIVRGELKDEQAVVGFCGGPFTVAGYLVEGRPSREFALVKALMYTRAGGLARADGEARRLLRLVRRRAGARRRRRGAALRLVGRGAFTRRLRGVRRAVVGAHPGRRRRADDPFRHRCVHAAPGDGAGGWRRDRARLADRPRRRLGDRRRRARRSRGTSIRHVLLGPWERIEAAARDVLARAGGRPGHIFNLGHGVLPRTDPDVVSRLAALVQGSTAEAPV